MSEQGSLNFDLGHRNLLMQALNFIPQSHSQCQFLSFYQERELF
jgi:hypothetical protein